MSQRSFLVACLMLGMTACGAGDQQSATPSASSSPTTTNATATTTAVSAASFTASANDVITALNVQLPLLQEGGQPLPTTVQPGGVFGGRVASGIDIFVKPQTSAFSKVEAVTVHVTGSAGAISTPARLLSGVGTSLHQLSPEAAEAFRLDALPKLSTLTQTRTTINVAGFYDMTVVVRDQSTLAFVFTPIGVTPLSSHETLGK